MDTNLRIMLIGKICGDDFAWIIPPPPVPQVSADDPDAAFDAPSPNNFSFFEHLIDSCKTVQTDENKLVSRYMNRNGFLDMQSNYYLDGWYAATEGQPLAAMPTEYHETGWWSAAMTQGTPDKREGSIEDDHTWIAGGC